ncbi:MAG: hypothetical protein ACLTWL_20375, partial [Eubacterium callanderi]|uniref:hypothetical protein n=1 Tax=Eubacterium callanderi TaxID=53442 RepID=UPI003992E73D
AAMEALKTDAQLTEAVHQPTPTPTPTPAPTTPDGGSGDNSGGNGGNSGGNSGSAASTAAGSNTNTGIMGNPSASVWACAALIAVAGLTGAVVIRKRRKF